MCCASLVQSLGSTPYFVSSPLVLTCTKTAKGGRPSCSTALFSLLASCMAPHQESAHACGAIEACNAQVVTAHHVHCTSLLQLLLCLVSLRW